MWTLVVITLMGDAVNAKIYNEYSNISKCLMARELLVVDMGGVDGFPLPDTQAVCIRRK